MKLHLLCLVLWPPFPWPSSMHRLVAGCTCLLSSISSCPPARVCYSCVLLVCAAQGRDIPIVHRVIKVRHCITVAGSFIGTRP